MNDSEGLACGAYRKFRTVDCGFPSVGPHSGGCMNYELSPALKDVVREPDKLVCGDCSKLYKPECVKYAQHMFPEDDICNAFAPSIKAPGPVVHKQEPLRSSYSQEEIVFMAQDWLNDLCEMDNPGTRRRMEYLGVLCSFLCSAFPAGESPERKGDGA